MNDSIHLELKSLLGERNVDRRNFVVTSLGAGFALAVLPFGRGIALVYGFERGGNARYESAVTAAREIATAVDEYRSRYHRVPNAEEGLAALTPDFLSRIPLDPWGRPFLYKRTDNDFADVLSYGADGEPTGEGDNADLSARYGRLGARPPQWLRRAAAVLMVALPLAATAAAFTGVAPAAADVLIGCAAFWSALLAASVGDAFAFAVSPLSPFALLACLLCLTGAVALLERRRGALSLTTAGVVAVQVALIASIVI